MDSSSINGPNQSLFNPKLYNMRLICLEAAYLFILPRLLNQSIYRASSRAFKSGKASVKASCSSCDISSPTGLALGAFNPTIC
mmetsp:Transcript_20285/g.49733  ORF Transcript_20285/g.49733 Transcript_20285/m.49733 type:complete len:83 (-) Transcript_20285:783-1031(-)